MSLHWNIEEIENSDEVCWIKRDPLPSEGDVSDRADENGQITVMNPVTHALIFSTISIGMGDWTEENIGDVVGRLIICRAFYGPELVTTDGHRDVTEEEIIAHIGLKTNVPFEARDGWIRRFCKRHMDEIASRINNQINRKDKVTV